MRVSLRTDGPLTAEAALERVLSAAAPLPPKATPLADAVGRVLCDDLRARADGPPFTNSARDGYAVRAADLAGASADNPVHLPTTDPIPAGTSFPLPLPPGQAVRIMTGAIVPMGADAVVMREFSEEGNGRVRLSRAPEPGEHVRPRGEDFRRGDILLRAGAKLRPWEIALLASQGLTMVNVRRPPAVAVVSTGDEVAETGASLSPGMLHDANGPALSAAALRAGAALSSLFRVPDDPRRLEHLLARALPAADVLLVSGGVSVGDKDHTRAVFAALGAVELFWRVAIRPGGPLLAGVMPGGKLLFGLPGNPLSALVCFEEFVRPLLERLQGLSPATDRFPLRGRAANGFRKPAALRQYVFVERRGDALHIPLQGSALLRTAARADALVALHIGVEEVNPGDELFYRELT